MNRKMLYMIVSITLMISLSACGSVNNKPVSVWQTTGINNSVNSGTNEDNTTNTGSDVISDEDNSINKADNYNVENGTKEYRGFVLDNVLHSATEGDIHYNVYIPDDYDGSESYALFMTLPGYQGLYFQGVGENVRTEEFGFVARDYIPKMIIVAPQLNDCGDTSARQTISREYMLKGTLEAERLCHGLWVCSRSYIQPIFNAVHSGTERMIRLLIAGHQYILL